MERQKRTVGKDACVSSTYTTFLDTLKAKNLSQRALLVQFSTNTVSQPLIFSFTVDGVRFTLRQKGAKEALRRTSLRLRGVLVVVIMMLCCCCVLVLFS